MHKKIIFFDIDGTLVDDDKNIPATTKQAIEELQDKGVYIAIATGRPPFMFKEIREELGIKSYVSFNGQHVVFEGKTIYENPIKSKELEKLYLDSLKYDYPMVFMSDMDMRTTTANHPFIKESLSKLKFEYPKIESDFHLKNTIFQALLFCEKDEEKQLQLNHKHFNFLRWHKFSCDIIPNGGSKSVGMNKILQASGLNKENSFAFGDGYNDMEMIQDIGTGIVMGNAVPELKLVADFVTTDVDNNGVLNGLQQYNLL